MIVTSLMFVAETHAFTSFSSLLALIVQESLEVACDLNHLYIQVSEILDLSSIKSLSCASSVHMP